MVKHVEYEYDSNYLSYEIYIIMAISYNLNMTYISYKGLGFIASLIYSCCLSLVKEMPKLYFTYKSPISVGVISSLYREGILR